MYHLSSRQGAVKAGEEEDFPQGCPDLPVPPGLCTDKVDSIKGSSLRRFFSDQTRYFFILTVTVQEALPWLSADWVSQ